MILITGITGFVGSHLADFLLGEGYEIFGSCRSNSNRANVDHLLDAIHLRCADLLDANAVTRLVTEARPDYIFHLAAQSNVSESWRAPAKTMETNVIGTVNLLEAVRAIGIDPIIQLACSSEEHGLAA